MIEYGTSPVDRQRHLSALHSLAVSPENKGGSLTRPQSMSQNRGDAESTSVGEKFESIFDTAEDAIFLYDVLDSGSGLEFELRRLNPAHEAISGLSAVECRGESPGEFLDDAQGAAVVENLRRCVECGETISYEEVLDMPAGTIHWRTKLTPIFEDGDVVQVVGVARDVTEQKAQTEALRRARERLDLALEATDTGVWEWNMETDEVVWNEALERLVGLEPGEFEGTFDAHADFLHPDALPKIEQAVAAATEGDGTFEAEFRMLRDDGDTIWVLGRGELFTDEDPPRMVGTTTDITDRKENELALARREILDPSVELEIHLPTIAALMEEHLSDDVRLTFDGIVAGAGESWLHYVTAHGVSPKDARATIDAIPTCEDVRLLSKRGETSTYEVVVGGTSIASVFQQFDGTLRSIVFEDGTCKLVGEFPETVDPAAVVETVRETYPDVGLASQTRIASATYLRSILEDILTDRQYSVLGMAYYAGYFEQPRQVTGDQLAERLGITRQTFNVHLRKAQTRLFEELFEGQLDLPD